MLEFLIDNIFVMFWTCFSTQYAFLWVPNVLLFTLILFFYSYDTDFTQGLLKKNKKEASTFL
jgi:hypothetical protein